MRITRSLLLASVAATSLGVGVAAAQQAPAPTPTTTQRLLNADSEPQNWLMSYGNYSNWHYSQLDQINKDNVANLRIVYMASIGGNGMSELPDTNGNENSQPLVENGILYLTDSHNKIMAFDVTSGVRAYPLWRHDPQVQDTGSVRGIGLYENTVIQNTPDARIIAVDKASGEVVWEVSGREAEGSGPNAPDTIATRAFPAIPQAYPTAGGKDILTIQPRGAGEGWLAAYDPTNGEVIWRTYTIPQPGEPNFGTWPDDKWQWGAAMPWGGPPAFDQELNMLFVGTGEPSPVYDPEFRPGDNLYSVSTLAMDADTGELKWFFQETPNDQWDFDSTASRILYQLGDRKVVSNWARNGFFYTLDRATGEFLGAVPEVDNINWTAGIDAKTGKPLEYNPSGGLQTYAVAGPRRGRPAADAPLHCATWGGAPTGIWPASFDPTSNITYNTRTSGCTYQTMTRTTDEAFNPLQREGLGSAVTQVQVDTKPVLIALDTQSGQVVNSYTRDIGIPSDRQAEVGALATAGGLVFTGFDDGSVMAFDKDTLEELWSFNVGTGLKGALMSFAVDGKQYVAHIAGGDNPGSSGIRQLIMPTAMLVVYGLPD
jgi:alcohol dehydrogenase (cytochrome c)